MPRAIITLSDGKEQEVEAVAVVGKAFAYDARQLRDGKDRGARMYAVTVVGMPYFISNVFTVGEAKDLVQFYGGDPVGIDLIDRVLREIGDDLPGGPAMRDMMEARSFLVWQSNRPEKRHCKVSGRFQVFAILNGVTTDVGLDDSSEAIALGIGLEAAWTRTGKSKPADFIRVTRIDDGENALPVLERRMNYRTHKMVTVKRDEKLVPFDPDDAVNPKPRLPLETIRVLYREKGTRALFGIPREMRPGQTPEDVRREYERQLYSGYPVRITTKDWIWLGAPGEWGDMGGPNRKAVEAFLRQHAELVPHGPSEWTTLPAKNPTVRESEFDLTYRLDRMRSALEKYAQEGAEAETLLAQIRATRGDPEARKALEDTMNTMAYHPRSPIYWEVITKGHFDLLKTYGWNLANALLMQYSMPKNLRKEIEQGLQYFNKRNIVMPKSKDRSMIARSELAASTFLKHLTQWRQFVEVAGEVLLSCQDNSSDAGCRVQVSSFALVNSGGFDEATMSEVAKALQAAEDALAGKGFARICYGEVHVTNRIGKEDLAAQYQPRPDTFLVRAVKKFSSEYVRICIHELGHRLVAKYDTSAARKARNSVYSRLDDGTKELRNTVSMPNVGEKLTIGKKTYEVAGFGKPHVSASTGRVTFIPADIISLRLDGDEFPKHSMTFAGWAKQHLGSTSKGRFITRYAMRDSEENFCEMLSFYCLDQLPEDQVELLKPVLLSFHQEPNS